MNIKNQTNRIKLTIYKNISRFKKILYTGKVFIIIKYKETPIKLSSNRPPSNGPSLNNVCKIFVKHTKSGQDKSQS